MKNCPPCTGDCNQGRACPADLNQSAISPFFVRYITGITILLAVMAGWWWVAS